MKQSNKSLIVKYKNIDLRKCPPLELHVISGKVKIKIINRQTGKDMGKNLPLENELCVGDIIHLPVIFKRKIVISK